MMKAWGLLATVLVVMVAGHASAASTHTTVTPANLEQQTSPALAMTVNNTAGPKSIGKAVPLVGPRGYNEEVR